MPALEDTHYPLRYILDISGPGLEVLVLHLGEHHGEIVPCGGHRVLRVDLLVLDHVFNGVVEVIVLQHHAVHLEDGGSLLAHLLQRLLIEGVQLL